MRKFVIAVAAAVFATGALAVEVAGVKVDDKATVAGQELVLNGAGVRTKVFIKIYVGSLYVPAKAADLNAVLAKGPRRIQMNIMRSLTPDQLVDALVDGLKDNNSTLDFVDGATKIGLNGTAKVSIPGEAFNRALTKIWLGDHPIQADLKKAMLGG